MATTLARLAGDTITLVQLIAQSPPEALPDAATLRSQLLSQLERVAKGAADLGVAPAEADEARFALAVWADEAILRSQWPGREAWANDTLQLQLFRTARGGNEFYEHLARLSPEQNDAREIYFLAMSLGFEGQYAGQPDQRNAVVSHQYETLRAAGRVTETSVDGPILPSAYEVDIELPRSGGLGLLAILGLIVGGLAVAYGIAWGVLYLIAGDVPLPKA